MINEEKHGDEKDQVESFDPSSNINTSIFHFGVHQNDIIVSQCDRFSLETTTNENSD